MDGRGVGFDPLRWGAALRVPKHERCADAPLALFRGALVILRSEEREEAPVGDVAYK